MPDVKHVSKAIQYLRDWGKEPNQPFFMALGILRPHAVVCATKWFDRIVPEQEIVLPPYLPEDMADVPAFGQQLALLTQMPTTEWMQQQQQWRAAIRAYLASVTFADAQLGRLIAVLEELGQLRTP